MVIMVQTQGSRKIVVQTVTLRVVQDSHSDYSADPSVVQYGADSRVVLFSSDEQM